jgi:uncharacterized protein
MVDDQQAVTAFLSNPSSYGAGLDRVDQIATHISLVFLAGPRAYKLKLAVKYPYLDFSTAARRREACAAELRLNRRTAPSLYLEVRRISRSPTGVVGWGTRGRALDWVVVMRRFEQHLLLDAIAGSGGLTPRLLQQLTAHIADFHAKAERRFDAGGTAAIAAVVTENTQCLRACRAVDFAAAAIDAVRDCAFDHLTRVSALLDERRAAGKVRRCHGDLHLRNICLLDGAPVLFDCIEFSEELACIDVLYDLAFLLMDLEHRGSAGLANLVANRYLDLTEEGDGLAALPLFLSLRAAIRAHVTATALDQGRAAIDTDAVAEARRYLDEARAALRPQPARLVAVGGLSGTGKSTLAAGLAPELGVRPGARVLRSDVIRKRLFGIDPETPLPPSAYTPEISRRVYARICEKALAALEAGYCVVIDAVALAPEERQDFAAVAQQAGVPFSGLWLEASAETMIDRIRKRRHDASDASTEILGGQLLCDPGTLDWIRIDAGRGPGCCRAAARRALGMI